MRTAQVAEPAIGETPDGLSPEELEAEGVIDLPNREAMSLTIPFGGHIFAQVLSKVSAALEQAIQQAPLEEGVE